MSFRQQRRDDLSLRNDDEDKRYFQRQETK